MVLVEGGGRGSGGGPLGFRPAGTPGKDGLTYQEIAEEVEAAAPTVAKYMRKEGLESCGLDKAEIEGFERKFHLIEKGVNPYEKAQKEITAYA